MQWSQYDATLMIMLSLDDVCMMMIMVMIVMLMTLLEPLMIDDFDGALEMPNDGPMMEITLLVLCMDDDDPLMHMMIALVLLILPL